MDLLTRKQCTAETIILDVQYNYTGFFEKGKSYVLLSADLNTIGSPDKYRVIFYTADKEDSASTIDLTNWVYIPQPELVISIFPNPIVIRAGEEKTVEIRLNSTSGFEPLVFLYTMAQPDLALNIGIDKLRMPSYGDATIPLTITASPNAVTRPYTVPIFANISFQSQSIIETISPETDLITNPSPLRSQNMTTVSSLTLTVLEPLSIAAKYGYIISFFTLIITTTLFTLQPLISKIVKFLPPIMDLKKNATFIIEIDAAVITGVLILISLQGIDLPRITGITATIVFPFAISVIVTLIHKEKLGTRLMIAGFINLMISIVLLALAII